MKAIHVAVLPAKPARQLTVHYDQESRTLTAESSSTKPWLYGIDIDGAIIFDLDEERVLANLDLQVPMSRWKRTTAASWPGKARAGSLMFARSTVSHKSFNIALQLTYDERAGILHLQIGPPKAHTIVVSLSENCLALAAHEELLGFVFRGLS